jgi:hypothetical protein
MRFLSGNTHPSSFCALSGTDVFKITTSIPRAGEVDGFFNFHLVRNAARGLRPVYSFLCPEDFGSALAPLPGPQSCLTRQGPCPAAGYDGKALAMLISRGMPGLFLA